MVIAALGCFKPEFNGGVLSYKLTNNTSETLTVEYKKSGQIATIYLYPTKTANFEASQLTNEDGFEEDECQYCVLLVQKVEREEEGFVSVNLYEKEIWKYEVSEDRQEATYSLTINDDDLQE